MSSPLPLPVRTPQASTNVQGGCVVDVEVGVVELVAVVEVVVVVLLVVVVVVVVALHWA